MASGVRVRGITIDIKADVTGLVDSFKKVDSQVKRLQNNLGSLTNYIAKDTSFTGLGNKFEAIKVKNELLGTEIDRVKQKIELEKKALASLTGLDPTPEMIERRQALNTQLVLDQAQLQSLEKEMKVFGSVGKQNVLAVGEAFEAWGAKVKEYGQSLISTGRSLSMYVTAPIVGVGTAAMKSSMEFESAMDKVQSVTLDATAEDMEMLSQAVLEMSGKSKYSAAEASEALYYMGLAGWNVNEMLAALPQVLAVATAGEMDLGRASDIVTDYFTAFGEGAGSVEHMVDVMARTMVSSNTDIDQLGDAFKYVAPVAGALGYTIEDVSLALGLMANNGIKASQAGTSLRQFMQRLVKPTAEVQKAMDELGITVADDEGNIKSFKQIMDELRAALGQTAIPAEELQRQLAILDEELEEGTITEEEYAEAQDEIMKNAYGVSGAEKAKNAAILAGVRGMSGLLAITNATAEDYKELTDAINGTTSAQDIAGVMIDNTKGRLEILKHSAENLGISFGQVMAPYIEKAISFLGGLVQKFSELDDGTKDTIVRIAGIAAAVGPLLIVAGSLISSIGSIASGIGSIIKLVATHPLLAAATALGAVVAALIIKHKEHEAAIEAERERVYGLTEEQKNLIKSIEDVTQAYKDSKETRENTARNIDSEIGYYQNLQSELSNLVDANGRVIDGYEDRVAFILGELNDGIGTELSLNDHIIEDYQQMQTEIDNLIEKKRQQLVLNSYEEDYEEALRNSTDQYHLYTEAANNHESAQKKVTEAEKKLIEYEKKYAGYSADARAEILANDEAYQLLLDDYNKAVESEEELSDAMKDAQNAYADTQNFIENYQKAVTAATTGTTQDAKQAIDMLLYDFQRFGTATEEQLQDQLTKYQHMYDQAQKDVAAGVAGVSQETVDGYAEMVRLAQAELDKMSKVTEVSFEQQQRIAQQGGHNVAESGREGLTSVDYSAPGSDNIKAYIGGMNSQQKQIEYYARSVATQTKSGIESVDMSGPGSEHVNEYIFAIRGGNYYDAGRYGANQTKSGYNSVDATDSGYYFVNGVAQGISKYTYKIEEAARSAASAGKQRFNRVLDIQSPSKVMMESGKFFDLGIALGIDKNADEVVKSAEALALETAAAFQANTASPLYGIEGGASSLTNKTCNLGGVTIQINQQPGESAEDLAELVMDRINREVEQRQMVYAV